MPKNWSELSQLIQGKSIVVERVRLEGSDIAIEGPFELPPLAKLAFEDQVFISAFVSTHGSIKEMEKVFGVSYPTIKSRLNLISGKLGVLQVDVSTTLTQPSRSEILESLDRGEISVKEALHMLKGEGT
jgi:hypothetical protein